MKRNEAEFRLSCFVADTLRWGCRRDVVWTHFPAGEERPAEYDAEGNRKSWAGSRLKRMGTLPGVADFVFITYGARVDFLELKAPKGTLSDEQKSFRGRVLALGCRYEIARSGQEAVEILRSWGILERVRVAA